MMMVAGDLSREGRQALLAKHYLKRLQPISHAFQFYDGDKLVAVITFGVPASRHLQKSACPTDPGRVLELNRLWVLDGMPRNTATQVISGALGALPPAIIVSYADTTAGHQGYVYRAANFNYSGWTDMERKTPRFDYQPNEVEAVGAFDFIPATQLHSRDAFRSGNFTRVRRRPKVKYWTVTGNRRERRNLERLCGWPKMNWKTEAPPQ
jgi:hypothetical protein